MIIALGSMFRNATPYLERYFEQVKELSVALTARGDSLRLILAEGDSRDETWEELAAHTARRDAVLVKRAHGGPHWPSVDVPERWKALSWVCNGVLDHVTQDVGALVYVESDLVWDAGHMVRLVDQLNVEHPAIAPMCFTAHGEFYDLWGHIKDGVGFGPFPPYHLGLSSTGLTRIDSAGSCTAMLGEVARRVRYGPDDLVRGLGCSIRANGYSLWVDPNLRVVHP